MGRWEGRVGGARVSRVSTKDVHVSTSASASANVGRSLRRVVSGGWQRPVAEAVCGHDWTGLGGRGWLGHALSPLAPPKLGA